MQKNDDQKIMRHSIWNVLSETFSQWSADNAVRLGAALSFYAIFSIAPLLVIAIAIAGFVYGKEAAQGQAMQSIQHFVGENAAKAINEMLVHAHNSGAGVIATIISVVTLIVVSSGLFAELQSDLDTIWGVAPKPGRAWYVVLRERLLGFLMVVFAGILLLAAMIASSVLSQVSAVVGGIPAWGWQALDWGLTILVFTIVFAIMFKYLPDAEIDWGDVWIGAFATSVLLTIGKYLIGLYLGWSTVSSAFGAAGSLAVLLLWIYYSAQIIFLGAEFAQVYANRVGSGVRPSENAVQISPRSPGAKPAS